MPRDDVPEEQPSDAPADAAPAREESKGGRRKRERGKRATVLKVLGVTVLVLALATALTVVFVVRHLNGNLEVIDISDKLQNRPEKEEVAGEQEPLNILVMGSDTRQGAGNAIDKESGAEASDTTILLHLSADRRTAYGISIPRDSVVDRPACEQGAIPPAENVMWNDAFTQGGPACTQQQFEQLTGVYVDDFIVVDFNGFKKMVDAIGGVEVCIPETIDDRAHGIYLEKGTREVEGREALAYVRQRYAVGNGSDIGRMKRQQAFIASMANKVVSARTLADPVRLFRFLDAATEALRVSPGLQDVQKLAGVGSQLNGIGLDNIQFLTIPWKVDPNDPNRVVWAPEAKEVWKRIANDQELTAKLTTDAISAAKPTTTKTDGQHKTESPEEKADRQQALKDAGLCG
ncbi:LCP family protein [Nocardioides rotundus]|uniref:LCP family protein n=1 Tax=Nocardioides rotundus TaxID=1774216 RepID=UPI001CBE141A|nr:LCP family protein [Nocardioides rotundus]UAL30387.1 LCP family protein [Nocardioides rotundus]